MKLNKLKALLEKIEPKSDKLNEWEAEFLESLEEKAVRLESDGKELFMSEKRTAAMVKILQKCGLVEGGDEEEPERRGSYRKGGRTRLKGNDGLSDDEVPF